MIIGICGFIGSGKDTIADYLVNLHHFRRESFASTLKDAVSQVFGWDRTMLEGRTKQAREWREQVDPWWAERLHMPTLTPRWILQYWGTEVCRAGFHDDIWIASLENKLRHSQDDVVISDCRFPNEIKAIKNAGGRVIRVTRGPEPAWYEAAASVNRGANGNTTWASAGQGTGYKSGSRSPCLQITSDFLTNSTQLRQTVFKLRCSELLRLPST